MYTQPNIIGSEEEEGRSQLGGLLFLPLPHLPQLLPQDLARGAARHAVDELDAAAQLLVRGDAGGDELLDCRLGQGGGGRGRRGRGAADDVGAGGLGALPGDADDGGVGDGGVGEEEGFQLGGGDLQALVLDEFLGTVSGTIHRW